MKKTSRLLSLLLASSIVVGALAGCSNQADNGGGAVFRKLYPSEVTTMNYLTTSATNNLTVAANTIDFLVEYDKYGVVKPSLAESWTTSDDGLTWTFKIRPDVYWVDDEGNQVAEVTAEDWVSSAKYVNDAANISDTQYMFNGIVKNAEEYYDRTAVAFAAETAVSEGKYATVDDYYKGESIEKPEPMDFSEVGVKAVDKYTLEYTLEAPKPYFLSVLSYGGYFPVYGPFLEECGENFGTDKDTLLYNGAYILSDFEPQVRRVLTKNDSYWDKDNVFIETIDQSYNSEANSIAPEMFTRGELDYAPIGADILDDWLANDDTKNLVSAGRVDNSYSYFYAFNFDPQFDAAYGPDNWKLAVNNENFRQSIMAGLDRVKAKSVSEPYSPETFITNTITPSNFATSAVSGKDYVTFEPLKAITDGDSFDEDKALSYKDAAMQELKAEGVTFPVKILMPYNPGTSDWDLECQMVEQQLETLLGSDYIDIIVEAGPSTNFLSSVRRTGAFALMKCNWGADYADPETWAEPFADDNSYNFMYKSEDAATKALVSDYYTQVGAAKAIVDDDDARFEAFAKAEASLIEHAVVIPFHVDVDTVDAGTGGYKATRLNQFESQYAPFGIVLRRFKGMKLMDEPMSMDQFDEAYATWKTERAAALEAAK